MQQSSKVLLLLVLGNLLPDLLRCIEDAKRRFIADKALLVLRVMLKSTDEDGHNFRLVFFIQLLLGDS